MSVVGRSVPRLEDRPLVTGRGRFAADVGLSAHAAHARGALGPRPWPDRVDRRRRGAGLAGRRGGLDLRGRRRHSADRFPADPHRGPGALPPDHPGPASGCAMSASRSRRCSRPTPTWRRTPPIWSPSRSRNCRSSSMPAPRPASSRTAARPSRRSWKSPTAISRRRFATPMPWWSSISRSGAIPAFRWKRAARSRGTMPAATCWSSMAPPRCCTGIATASPACSGVLLRACICTKAMSAAASAFAASSIPRTSWFVSPRCGSAGR